LVDSPGSSVAKALVSQCSPGERGAASFSRLTPRLSGRFATISLLQDLARRYRRTCRHYYDLGRFPKEMARQPYEHDLLVGFQNACHRATILKRFSPELRCLMVRATNKLPAAVSLGWRKTTVANYDDSVQTHLLGAASVEFVRFHFNDSADSIISSFETSTGQIMASR
jgi:hypothetical protein